MLPESYFEMKLDEATKYLKQRDPSEELVSIKIRPQMGFGDFDNAYVYPHEYEEILKSLSTFKRGGEGSVSRGRAYIFEPQSDQIFLFVEHETGPEIIAYLHTGTEFLIEGTKFISALGGAVAATAALIKAVDTTIKIIRRSAKEHASGKANGRYYKAIAMRLEIRKSSGSKIIGSISVE